MRTGCVRCGFERDDHPIPTECPVYVRPAPLWVRLLTRVIGGRQER